MQAQHKISSVENGKSGFSCRRMNLEQKRRRRWRNPHLSKFLRHSDRKRGKATTSHVAFTSNQVLSSIYPLMSKENQNFATKWTENGNIEGTTFRRGRIRCVRKSYQCLHDAFANWFERCDGGRLTTAATTRHDASLAAAARERNRHQ